MFRHALEDELLFQDCIGPCFFVELQSGENPLHIAVRRSHFPIVKELIQFLHNEMSRLDAVMAVNEQSMVSTQVGS